MLYTSDMWIFLLSATIILLLIIITWHKRHFSSGRAFLILLLCAFVWPITFALEIAAQSLELKILMAKFEFIAITFLPLAWLYLILNFIGYVKSPKYWVLLSVIPLITNVIIWFVPRPNWFWGKPSIQFNYKQWPVLDYDYGIWFYYVHAPYSYLLIFAALVMMICIFFKIHSIYRYQILLLIVAVLIPVITDILYVAGYLPSHYNYTTANFSISCIIITWALFRYKFLDLLPMARDVVFENMDDGVMVFDDKNRIIDINLAAINITGISKRDTGLHINDISSGSVSTALKKIVKMDKKQIEIKMGGTDNIHVYDLRLSFIKDQMGQVRGSVVTLRDCTERTNLLNKLREEAIRDSLTGIINRRQLIKLGQKELNRIRRHQENSLCVILIDLDKFKNINDKYGHATGDQALIAFTEQCKKCICPYDIFGRLGGEEFIVILPHTELEEAVVFAERIKTSIEEMRISTRVKDNISMTVSIGVVSSRALDSFDLGLERLFNMADELMYNSKRQGGNQVSY